MWGRKVVSVFIGGGTPSLFSAAAIDRLLAGIRARLPLTPGAEITLEANPGTFERQKFAGFFAAGVNRLSLGIQSFDPAQLKALGRVHDDDEARRAAEAALMIFGNVNFDLMYGLPRQTVEGAQADLAAALAFAPPHLSFYHLTLEPNTLFHRAPPPLPDEDTAADIEGAVHATLARAGYAHYETSAYAQAGTRLPAQHELLAVRRLSRHRRRRACEALVCRPHRAPAALEASEAVSREDRGRRSRCRKTIEVSRDDIGFEFMLNALRLTEGVPASLFAERTGYPLALVRAADRDRYAQGPARPPIRRVLQPTELGRRFQNDLLELFLPERRPPRVPSTRLIEVEATGVPR